MMTPSKITLFLLVLAASCKSQTVDQQIVLINVETLDRSDLARTIEKIAKYNPEVIGVDVIFDHDTDYSSDYRLFLALESCKNLIMASIIERDSENRLTLSGSLDLFLTNSKTGFVNTVSSIDSASLLKYFNSYEELNTGIEYHFAVMVSMAVDSLVTAEFVNSHAQRVQVMYPDSKFSFKVINASEILRRDYSRDIGGKIVLLGYVGPSLEDKFSYPREALDGQIRNSFYGVEYLGHLVVQILNQHR